jgi:hypothetical protein
MPLHLLLFKYELVRFFECLAKEFIHGLLKCPRKLTDLNCNKSDFEINRFF